MFVKKLKLSSQLIAPHVKLSPSAYEPHQKAPRSGTCGNYISTWFHQAANAIQLAAGMEPTRIPLAEEWARFRTHLFGHLVRFFVAFERLWYDLLSESSPFAVNAAIGAAWVLTFFAIWIPLSALTNTITFGVILSPFLPDWVEMSELIALFFLQLPLLLPRNAIETWYSRDIVILINIMSRIC